MKNLLWGRRRKAAPARSQPSHTASDRALGPDLSNGANGADVPNVPPARRFIGSTKANDKQADEKVDETYRALQDADRRNSARSRISRARSGPFGAAEAGNILGAVQGDAAIAQQYSTAQSFKDVYDSAAMETVRDGVNALLDSIPGLLKALDEVAKLHPFIAIAVVPFRVVIELNIKRQNNDKKIGVLFLKMRDMMDSLLQLRAIKRDSKGADGQSIEARLKRVVEEAADEVKNCANVCDTYAKKNVVVKVIMATVWDAKLSSFIDIFVARRREIMYALAIHTGKGVEDANRKLDKMDTKIDVLTVLLEFFRTAVSPEQQELIALIARHGGAAAVMANDDTLNNLIQFKSKSDSSTMKRGRDSGPGESEPPRGQRADRDGSKLNSHAGDDSLAAVKQELIDGADVAIQKNLEVFERKFAMQRRELEAEMQRIVHHEGDRVIAAVNSGAHDRIIDPEIHEIWKEMQWPGHVKARHFVLALRDYYSQQLEKKRKAQKDMQWISHPSSRQLVLSIRDKVDDLTKRKGNEETTRVSDQDEWTLKYISINRLQALAEAFDDDASGFITVAEVNSFTSSRPKEWRRVMIVMFWHL